MTNWRVLLIAAAASMAGACRERPEAEQAGPAEIAAVLAVDSAFAVGMNAGSIDAIARTYDEDGWLLPPQSLPVRGREGIRGFWGGFLRSYNVYFKFGVERFEIRGDRAYVVGHYRLETAAKSSEVPPLAPENGKFLEILKRQPDGTWGYLVDMYSANAPPNATAPPSGNAPPNANAPTK